MTVPTVARPGRNEPCHCGSGRKYKQCCLEADEKQASAALAEAEAVRAAQPSDGAPVAPGRPQKHQTSQPWKGTESRGFTPRSRTPRKVGGA
jgi:hypothetical protein